MELEGETYIVLEGESWLKEPWREGEREMVIYRYGVDNRVSEGRGDISEREKHPSTCYGLRYVKYVFSFKILTSLLNPPSGTWGGGACMFDIFRSSTPSLQS